MEFKLDQDPFNT